MNPVRNRGHNKRQKTLQKNNRHIAHTDNNEPIHNPHPVSSGVKFIFVYNSDGTVLSLVKDTAHKVVSPDTYPCNLCRIIYPGVTMQEDWRKFIQSLPHEVIFLHRDEFRKRYPNQKSIQLPAVFTERASDVALFVPHTEINKTKNIGELIETVKRFLSKQA